MVNRINHNINPVGQGITENIKLKVNPAVSFQEVLSKQLNRQPLKFSAHALNRLEQRDLSLNPETVNRLESGVKQAAAKGARQSLIMVDNLAFVVSVANKTVITAISDEGRKENVFTNIDSAVIA